MKRIGDSDNNGKPYQKRAVQEDESQKTEMHGISSCKTQ